MARRSFPPCPRREHTPITSNSPRVSREAHFKRHPCPRGLSGLGRTDLAGPAAIQPLALRYLAPPYSPGIPVPIQRDIRMCLNGKRPSNAERQAFTSSFECLKCMSIRFGPGCLGLVRAKEETHKRKRSLFFAVCSLQIQHGDQCIPQT